MADKKIKLNFLEKEEISPYVVDLRKKEKKRIKINPVKPILFFKKLAIIFGIAILFFVAAVVVKDTYSRILSLQQELLKDISGAPEMFFAGFDNLKTAKFLEAEQNFYQANQIFSEKIQRVEKANFFISNLFKIYPPSRAAVKTLNIFNDSSKIGLTLAKTGQEIGFLTKMPEKLGNTNNILPPELMNFNFLEKIEFLKTKVREILLFVGGVDKNLVSLNQKYIPSEFQNAFNLIKKEAPSFKKNIDDLLVFLDDIEKIVGKNSSKRYLILFQNNNEMRPTGGFLGTYAQIDFANGKIKSFEMPAGGTYDLAGQLSVMVAPPKPLLIAYPKWQFHDANWFPDWPTSAQKLQWFYERSGGVTVDGVWAINADLLPEILEIIGEVPMPAYEKTLNKDNFILEIQKTIEQERKETEKPKQILVDLAPVVIKKIFSLEPSKIINIAEIISRALKEKKIIFYFADESIEKNFSDKNFSGEIRKSPLDYLMISTANVNGSKTEEKISQKISYKLEISNDGSMIATLTIRRKHNGVLDEPFFGRPDVSWIRAYLPKGVVFLGAKTQTKKSFPQSELAQDKDLERIEKEISFDKFSNTRITEEFDKTCFGNFLEINPGEEREITFKYLLPFKLDFSQIGVSYNLLVQKQLGRENEFEAEIILPEGKKIAWFHPKEEIKQEDRSIKISSTIDRDKIFAFIIE